MTCVLVVSTVLVHVDTASAYSHHGASTRVQTSLGYWCAWPGHCRCWQCCCNSHAWLEGCRSLPHNIFTLLQAGRRVGRRCCLSNTDAAQRPAPYIHSLHPPRLRDRRLTLPGCSSVTRPWHAAGHQGVRPSPLDRSKRRLVAGSG